MSGEERPALALYPAAADSPSYPSELTPPRTDEHDGHYPAHAAAVLGVAEGLGDDVHLALRRHVRGQLAYLRRKHDECRRRGLRHAVGAVSYLYAAVLLEDDILRLPLYSLFLHCCSIL